jgi:hypothetical protein
MALHYTAPHTPLLALAWPHRSAVVPVAVVGRARWHGLLLQVRGQHRLGVLLPTYHHRIARYDRPAREDHSPVCVCLPTPVSVCRAVPYRARPCPGYSP